MIVFSIITALNNDSFNHSALLTFMKNVSWRACLFTMKQVQKPNLIERLTNKITKIMHSNKKEETQEEKCIWTLDENNKNHIKFVFQDCNINFLIGSGLSTPFFATLGKIEKWLTELEEKKESIEEEQYTYIKASLYNIYFESAIQGNLDVLEFDEDKKDKSPNLNNTFSSYKCFLKTLNDILYERRSNTASKQVNLFTTNIDIFLEKTLENLDLHFNDGFNGIFKKKFSLSNFKKSFYQKSFQYDNISELPVFNLLKLHGSVTWKMIGENIQFSSLECVDKISKFEEENGSLFIKENTLNNKQREKHEGDSTVDEIAERTSDVFEFLGSGKDLLKHHEEFLGLYEELQIINPTKEKFKNITFNKTYHELLRFYANELEKENTVLFVMGFSMADEHIREMTIRALKSNPTLKVFFVPYMQDANDIKENFKADELNADDFPNIGFINPEDEFTLQRFNKLILEPLLKEISKDNNSKKH